MKELGGKYGIRRIRVPRFDSLFGGRRTVLEPVSRIGLNHVRHPIAPPGAGSNSDDRAPSQRLAQRGGALQISLRPPCGTFRVGDPPGRSDSGPCPALSVGFRVVRGGRHVDLSRLVRAAAEQLLFASESCELITALGVIEHLDDDKGFLSELHRVCRPGGHVLLPHLCLRYPLEPARRDRAPQEAVSERRVRTARPGGRVRGGAEQLREHAPVSLDPGDPAASAARLY